MDDYTRRAVLAAVGTGAMGASAGVSGASSHGGTENDTNGTGSQGGTQADESRDDAVRIVHLSPDAPTVDVYADGSLAFEDVDPLTKSEYRSYAPGTYTLTFVPAGEDPEEAIYETDVELESGEYTLAAIGEVCSMSDRPFELVRFEDENGPTEAGNARIRGIHASPDAPPIDVVADDGTVLFEGIEFGEGSYTEVPAEERVIELREAGEETGLARFRIEPEVGNVYTGYAVGYLNPEDAPDAAPDGSNLALAITNDAKPGTSER